MVVERVGLLCTQEVGACVVRRPQDNQIDIKGLIWGRSLGSVRDTGKQLNE